MVKYSKMIRYTIYLSKIEKALILAAFNLVGLGEGGKNGNIGRDWQSLAPV